MEPDAMILVFWMLSFKPTFSFSSFTFIKRLFSSSPLSAIRVVSSAYLRLLAAAAAAAKSLQSCLTPSNPKDCSLPGSSVHGIFQARILEWVAISFSSAWKWKVKMKSLSRPRLLATPRTAAYQAPPSMGFSRHEYWSGVPWPSPNYVPRSCKYKIWNLVCYLLAVHLGKLLECTNSVLSNIKWANYANLIFTKMKRYNYVECLANIQLKGTQ